MKTALTRMLMVSLFVMLSFSASHAKGKIRVLTTSTDLKSIAEYVGGDRVEVKSIATGAEDLHFVDAKPSSILQAQKTDLFVVVGLEMEVGWAPSIIDGARNPKIRPGNDGYVDASVGCNILEKPMGKVDRSMGDIHPYGNPHYWLDPANGKIISENIARALKKISPSDADYFEKNKNAFQNKIDEKLKTWQAKMKPYKGAKIVTYHRSFPNFARRFGLDVIEYMEPKPGIPPSPSHLAKLILKMKKENVKLIMVEPYLNLRAAKVVAGKTGATVLSAPPSVGGVKSVNDYFELFDYLVDNIVKILSS